MPKRASKLLVLGTIAAAGIFTWTIGKRIVSDDTEADGTKHVVNQVWLERMPDNSRDMIGHLVIIDHPEGKIGAAGRSSQWRHFIEVFLWRLDGSKLDIFLPQDEVRAQLKVRSWECADEAPRPFELCLEIAQGDRRAVYYSRKDWRIQPTDVEESLEDIGEDAPDVAALVRDSLAEPGEAQTIPESSEHWPQVAGPAFGG
jgi:hypothetical protein